MRRTIICAAAFFTGAYLASTAAFGLVPNSNPDPIPTVTHTVTVDQTFTGAEIAAYVKHKHAKPTLPKCKTEDSDNCIWNARTSGNGKGKSFIAYRGHVYYLDTTR